MVPALISIKSYQRFASPVRVAILMTGTAISPYGVPRPVVKTRTVMPWKATWRCVRRRRNAGGRRGVNQAAFAGRTGDTLLDNGALTRRSDRAQRFSTTFASPPFCCQEGLALRRGFLPISL